MKLTLRRKIFIVFFLFLAASGTVWFLNFNTYRLLVRHLELQEKKDAFLNRVLETRRYEKNYFLTGERSHLVEAVGFIDQAENRLPQIKSNFGEKKLSFDFSQVEEALLTYRLALLQLLKYYDATGQPIDAQMKANGFQRHKIVVGDLGNVLTTDAEKMVKNQQGHVNKLLAEKKRYHFIALAEILVLCIFTVLFLIFSVNRPLKAIENGVNKILQGDYENIPPLSMSGEFEALVNSLNHMLNELNRRTEQLYQSKKMASLGTLTSGVAHELNNPLNNISTSVQILLEELDEGDTQHQRQQLEETERQVDRARDIVKALLEFSRQTDYHVVPVRIQDLIEDTIRLVGGEVPANVEIKTDVLGEIQADMDPRQIQQALINLTTNGIHAMPEGGVLEIRAFVNPDKEEVCIQVRDSGTGISQENLTKIFDPFFSTKDVGSGTGLGLSVTHGIVKKHGGRVDVESEMGSGTTFSIFLPYHPSSIPA
jgi:two-component system NtrC family sensor kinase